MTSTAELIANMRLDRLPPGVAAQIAVQPADPALVDQIDMDGYPAAGCWHWTGTRSREGYGTYGPTRDRLAHRLVWESVFDPIPAGMTVAARCHQWAGCAEGPKGCPHRRCVNPAHLAVRAQEYMDPEQVRARKREYHRDRREDPAFRNREAARMRTYDRERYQDPEYREPKLAYGREYHRKRYAEDPWYRGWVKARARMRREASAGP